MESNSKSQSLISSLVVREYHSRCPVGYHWGGSSLKHSSGSSGSQTKRSLRGRASATVSKERWLCLGSGRQGLQLQWVPSHLSWGYPSQATCLFQEVSQCVYLRKISADVWAGTKESLAPICRLSKCRRVRARWMKEVSICKCELNEGNSLCVKYVNKEGT